LASLAACTFTFAIALAACGPSTIRVVGVMQRSSEMQPLPSVPLGGYQQLHLLVRASPGQSAEQYGSPDCGYTTLEGTDEGQDLRNAACVPTETLNTAIGIVRQRLRAYGVTVASDASEPCDFTVEVGVTGEAPKKPDRTLAKAVATVTFKLHPNTAGDTLVSGIDLNTAAAAFNTVSNNCGLRHAELSSFAASTAQPMTPDFDIVKLASDAVDNLLRCYDLASFFLDARTRFPKPSRPEQPGPGPGH
jgi:hypothetical protein